MNFLFRLITLLAAIVVTTGTVRSEEITKTSLWKLSDDNSTVYLAGSVHLLREVDLPFPRAFDTAYHDSSELIFEIDMERLSDPSAAMKIRRLGTLPQGESLDNLLGEETMIGLQHYLKERGLPEALFDRFTPGMVFLTIGSLEATRQGARPDLGMETQFYQRATKDGKPSRGLETAEFQMSCFDELNIEILEELIHEIVEEIEKDDETLDSIIEAWKTGNLEDLDELVVEKMAESPELKKVLLTDRNKNWIPEIEKTLTKDHNAMFIVGAAHLVGDDSVIDLLEKKGFHPVQVGKRN
tara:strand:- start:201 stop:1094 length:894 start_codon:yes stop_codon:yes gene_type:complete